MKKENKPTNKETDKNKEGHENQNIHDFNPSQFTTQEDLKKIKEEKEKAKKEGKEKLDESKK